MPTLDPTVEPLLRAGYGVLLFATLVMTLPHARRFFVSERWGGYGQSLPEIDLVQNPRAISVVLAAWLTAAALIALGWWSPWPALLNLALCYYFFIRTRWKSLLRGMGAPGYLCYWLGMAVVWLELTRLYLPSVRPLALLVLQVDFAVIMLMAGFYKIASGYPRNNGMELGMVNPEWGYHWRRYLKMRPSHTLFWVLNQLAWFTEVFAGLLMLIPPTRPLGAALIALSFVFIATQIRLLLLCHMVIVACLLYVPGSSAPVLADGGGVESAARVALTAYLALMLLAYGGLAFNMYAQRRLPELLQRALELYTNLFGMILWRVFSVDVVNFCVMIYRQPRAGGPRVLVSEYERFGVGRFNSVAEAIVITSVFTSLRYFADGTGIFEQRLRRYAATLPVEPDEVLVFEYLSIRKGNTFELVPAAEFIFDPADRSITERILDPTAAVRGRVAGSPLHQGSRPGSYAPAR